MFPALQLEVMERFTAVEQHFTQSKTFRGSSALTAKGLVFVQLYAIHEYCVREVVRVGAAVVASHGHSYGRLESPLLALFLDPELSSVKDCGSSNIWERRIEMLERALSDTPVVVAGNPLPGRFPFSPHPTEIDLQGVWSQKEADDTPALSLQN